MERIAYLVIGAAVAVVVMTLLPMAHMPMDMTATEMPGRDASEGTGMAGMDAGPATQGVEMEGIDMSAMGILHPHPPREVSPGLPIPGLTHLMFPDAMDGYNVQILPRDFTFTPADVNREATANEGHAHVYVNGAKVARVYSEWFHLSGAGLRPGDNEVTVTLNANDHSEWSVNGVAIASTLTVPGPVAAASPKP